MAMKVFKVTYVFLVLWALTKTESGGITCRKGQGDVARGTELISPLAMFLYPLAKCVAYSYMPCDPL